MPNTDGVSETAFNDWSIILLDQMLYHRKLCPTTTTVLIDDSVTQCVKSLNAGPLIATTNLNWTGQFVILNMIRTNSYQCSSLLAVWMSLQSKQLVSHVQLVLHVCNMECRMLDMAQLTSCHTTWTNQCRWPNKKWLWQKKLRILTWDLTALFVQPLISHKVSRGSLGDSWASCCT